MAFLFETRTLGSIVSSVASEATTTTSLAPDSTSPTLTALLTLETATTTLAPVILSTVSTSVAKILETTTTTEDPGFFDEVSTMTNEDSTLARIVEMFNEKPESLGLQDVMVADNNTNAAISTHFSLLARSRTNSLSSRSISSLTSFIVIFMV